MKQLKIEEVAGWLLERDNFVLLTHRRPDGDTVGSASALCLGLRALGKRAFVLENPQMTDKYGIFLEGLIKEAVEPGDTVVSTDVAAGNMFPMGFEGGVELLLDHHGSNSGFAPVGLVRADAAACGEIIYDLLGALGVTLDPEMARRLYLAVSTDTGCFRHANTEAHTLEVAAACYATGAELFSINKTMFETVRFPRLKLNAYMADHVELLRHGTIAICVIPKAVEEDLGITSDDTEDLASFLRNIEGVGLAATIRQGEPGVAKLSLRAAPGYDCSAVCAHLGGGGHKGAAGATTNRSLEEARAALLKALTAEGLL